MISSHGRPQAVVPNFPRARSIAAFTLVEMVIVLFILAVLCITLVIPAFSQSRRESIENARLATCKTLMDAAQVSRLHGGIRAGIPEENVGWIGSTMLGGAPTAPVQGSAEAVVDSQTAFDFYLAHNYIKDGTLDITGVQFLGGEWKPLPWN
jgi:prepilin-type N-terminal cleavage/methylation domain-containing protein